MLGQSPSSAAIKTGTVAICGNPNCGKTTLFNAITGLNQHVANYPGVTVEKVTGHFTVGRDNKSSFTLVDIPGTYSLSAFSPDEDIAVSALTGSLKGSTVPDVIICVLDATNLERSLTFLLQVMEIGRPMVAAVNMVDLAEKQKTKIDFQKLSKELGGIPVVPVVGNRRVGITELKEAVVEAINKPAVSLKGIYGDDIEELLTSLKKVHNQPYLSRAEYLRVIFDVNGSAEKRYLSDTSEEAERILSEGRQKIKDKHGALTLVETSALTKRATEIYRSSVHIDNNRRVSVSERIDRVLLNPFFGPIILLFTMIIVFQSIFSWAEPLMEAIDSLFGWLASLVETSMAPGPLQSLLTDGVIGGVGSVLIFLPQIIILFIFIAVLEDSGYMSRAAFLVDRLFRWCGLSGKSFIPMLSSFACAVPGILATRTIEDRKLRYITILVAPLMTCSARLPVYAIMIAAFIPYKTYFGLFNLQGMVLTSLYLLGIIVAVIVSYVLKKLIFKAERGTFLMELPSYKLPTMRSVGLRVYNRAKAFILRAGTVILAITIIIWALSYFPRNQEIIASFAQQQNEVKQQYQTMIEQYHIALKEFRTTAPVSQQSVLDNAVSKITSATDSLQATALFNELIQRHPDLTDPLTNAYKMRLSELNREQELIRLSNEEAGANLRHSYFAIIGHAVAPVFEPLGWDWKITMATLSAFPAREVIIATLGTIYNLGSGISEVSSSLVNKMRQTKWEDGPRMGQVVFTPAVALSVMIFFALSAQCGATLVTIKKETGSWWYSVGTFVYMTTLAYLTACAAYQLFSRIWY